MRTIRHVFSMAAAAGIFLAAHAAHAQSATEYNVIVLDQTGSMHVPGHDNGPLLNGQPSINNEVFDNAINAAINWLVADQQSVAANTPSAARGYAIFTFKDDNCCGGTQGGLVQIWPPVGVSNTVGCTSGVDLAKVEASTGFCVFNSGKTDPYDGVMAVLDSLRFGKNDPNKLLKPISGGTGGASYDTALYGLGPNTPLANAFCDAAERLVLSKGLANVVFTLETDGGENFSTAQAFQACAGTNDGFVNPSATSFVKSASDWGLTAGGWKSKVMRRVTRFNQPGTYPAPKAGGPAANDAQDQSIVATAIKTPPDDVQSNSKWRIDVHFSICDTNFSSPPPCPEVTASSLMATTSATTTTLAVAPSTPRAARDRVVFSPAGPRSAVATTTPATFLPGKTTTTTAAPTTLALAAATTTSTRTQSISANELAFFKAVGTVNSKSTFRQFVRDPAAAQPVHVPRIPGDVDDSGCTDGADFRIVTQSGVYYQAAVLPNQLAIRADLNGDQWVNKLDAQIVLNNWGKGCINSPGPKPVLKH